MFLIIFVLSIVFTTNLNAETSYLARDFNKDCSLSRTYKVIKFDPRFGISKGELRLALINAGALWNKALGKKVFREVFNKDADIDISLEYTEGLKVYLKAKEMLSKGLEINLDYDEFSEIQRKQREHGNDLKEKIIDINKKISEFDREIQLLQSQGRLTQTRRNYILSEMNRLRNDSRKINQEVHDFNANSTFMNDWAGIINNKQKGFREELSFLNKMKKNGIDYHEAGLYRRLGDKEDIYLKLFSNKQELKAVIAHEFGHALGLGHIKDPNSIMYFSMQNQPLTNLSKSDILALKSKCRDSNNLF
jgi:predicted Zn-dependent protease